MRSLGEMRNPGTARRPDRAGGNGCRQTWCRQSAARFLAARYGAAFWQHLPPPEMVPPCWAARFRRRPAEPPADWPAAEGGGRVWQDARAFRCRADARAVPVCCRPAGRQAPIARRGSWCRGVAGRMRAGLGMVPLGYDAARYHGGAVHGGTVLPGGCGPAGMVPAIGGVVPGGAVSGRPGSVDCAGLGEVPVKKQSGGAGWLGPASGGVPWRRGLRKNCAGRERNGMSKNSLLRRGAGNGARAGTVSGGAAPGCGERGRGERRLGVRRRGAGNGAGGNGVWGCGAGVRGTVPGGTASGGAAPGCGERGRGERCLGARGMGKESRSRGRISQ